jgi:hypothetical protein
MKTWSIVPVESSMIASALYDGNDLVINFKRGGSYRYIGAKAELAPLVDAESAGKYFLSNIKGKYEWVQIEVL